MVAIQHDELQRISGAIKTVVEATDRSRRAMLSVIEEPGLLETEQAQSATMTALRGLSVAIGQASLLVGSITMSADSKSRAAAPAHPSGAMPPPYALERAVLDPNVPAPVPHLRGL